MSYDNCVGYVENSYKTFSKYTKYELIPNSNMMNGFNSGAYLKVCTDDGDVREVFIEPEALLGVAKMFTYAAEEVKIK